MRQTPSCLLPPASLPSSTLLVRCHPPSPTDPVEASSTRYWPLLNRNGFGSGLNFGGMPKWLYRVQVGIERSAELH
ncbi:hypothetical protein PYCCODRAFT_1441158 [Trametes coccinea BRFM310]|uniref:Uncharacterized protein n=1 Tax=Trametes coccinea (strain BRFM310) TaxID=1353009 RepID=A0A1Y2I562_TRAC3|nr:hypothetical protein PYCCODRAFT_1441158 [Trametes coccinea BRFM310]